MYSKPLLTVLSNMTSHGSQKSKSLSSRFFGTLKSTCQSRLPKFMVKVWANTPLRALGGTCGCAALAALSNKVRDLPSLSRLPRSLLMSLMIMRISRGGNCSSTPAISLFIEKPMPTEPR